MKSNSISEVHLLSCQLDEEADRARKKDPLSASFKMLESSKDYIIGWRLKLIQYIHFLAHQHIAHTTNFDKLVELVVSCGGETLQTFLDRAGGNATYTSKWLK